MDNSFSISDELLLPADTFTFVSSSHGSTSWLDHVLSITSGHALVEILFHLIISLYVLIYLLIIDKEIVCTSTSVCSTNDESPSFNWKDLTDNDLLKLNYSICTKKDLSRICIPSSMLDSVIMVNGDFSDKNNYRPIALSSTISKVFENVILYRLEECLWTTDNQFGFKAGHSTDLSV